MIYVLLNDLKINPPITTLYIWIEYAFRHFNEIFYRHETINQRFYDQPINMLIKVLINEKRLDIVS